MAPPRTGAATVAALAACIAGAPVAARADPGTPRLRLSGFLGAHIFSGSSSLGDSQTTSIANAPALGPRLGFRLSRLFSVEGELPLALTSSRDDRATLLILLPRVQLRYDFAQRDWLKPNAVAGLGAPISLSNHNSVLESDLGPEAHVGVGAAIERAPGIGFRVDLRAIAVPARGAKLLAPEFELLVGVYLRPHSAAPHPRRQPQVADSDEDGIPDPKDGCPDSPEDFDKIQDDDGCPEIDADFDGVLDAADQCRDELESKNGYKDDDGCPDDMPEDLAALEGPIEGVSFGPGSTTLRGAGRRALNRIARILQKYPSVRIILSGHTDATGDPQANVILSLQRSEAVADYLLKRGVKEHRLITVGAGPDEPIADNDSARGRAQNRRIELRIWVYEP